MRIRFELVILEVLTASYLTCIPSSVVFLGSHVPYGAAGMLHIHA